VTARDEYYDKYWDGAEAAHFDRRSRERARLAAAMISHSAGRLLDAGAGRGVAAAFFRERGFEVVALDISPHALAYCRQRGVEARAADLESDDVGGPYDVVLVLEVLEHLEKPQETLIKLKNALSAGGEIIISMPNDRNIYHGGLPKDAEHPHLNLYDEPKARSLIESCGLKIESFRRVPLLPSWCVGLRALFALLFQKAGIISTIFRCTAAAPSLSASAADITEKPPAETSQGASS
jgi:SAM-dependent methyltransferase